MTKLVPASDAQIILLLDRPMVINGTFDSVLDRLSKFAATATATREHAHRLSLIFDGYEHDSREIYQIPEVRRYVRGLTERWPYWFHFINKADHNLLAIMKCLMEIQGTTVKDGIARSKTIEGEFSRVIRDLFIGMNYLYERHGFTQEENSLTTRAIKDYLDSLDTA